MFVKYHKVDTHGSRCILKGDLVPSCCCYLMANNDDSCNEAADDDDEDDDADNNKNKNRSQAVLFAPASAGLRKVLLELVLVSQRLAY